MKKLLTATTIVGLLFSAIANAAPAVTNYYSSQKSKMTTISQAKLYPATDIGVYNWSSDYIYTLVPNSPINDRVYPQENYHIYNDTYYGMTHIVLQDPTPYRNVFFDGYVCRYAVVNVYGYPGSYNVYVNSSYC